MARLNLFARLILLLVPVMAIVSCGGKSTPVAESSTVTSIPEFTVAPQTLTTVQNVSDFGSQNLRYEHLSSVDGLSENTINCILQDRYGFIWIGTDQGLNKYDGHKLTAYWHVPDDPNSLSYNNVWTILEALLGRLWIRAFGGGPNRFARATAQFARYGANDFQYAIDEPVAFLNVIYSGKAFGNHYNALARPKVER